MRKEAIQDTEGIEHPTRRLRVLRTVKGDYAYPWDDPAEARIYEPHEIKLRRHGGVSVLTKTGWCGIRPDERKWIDD